MKKALGPVTLAYPMPAFLVAAYDEEGKANIMTAAWGGICCSNPPCIAVSLRPERWTHKAIVARRAFTVCVPSAAQAAMVDFAGMVSGARGDKFSATGLTAVRSTVVDAPYVDECPLVLECELQATLELGSHTQFVGRILNVGIETDCLNESGQPDMYRIDPVSIVNQVSPYCDCHAENDAAVVPDIGMFASFDPVALDHACIDAVNAAPAISTSVLGQCAHEHNDHFTDIHPSTNWRSQIEHAQKIGIGNMDYELVTVK